jgi:hypothetical protein
MHAGTALLVERPAAAPVEAPLQVALRQALRQGSGRVALAVTPAAAHQRRVARALLQEGAQAAGGQVVEGPGGDLVLVGAEAGRAVRLRQLLDRLLGGSATHLWSLERDLPALRHYAAGEAGEAGPDLAGLDAWLAAVPLPPLLQRSLGRRAEGPGFLRIEIARAALQARLGGLGADADLLRHAAQALAARLLRGIADPAQARALLGTPAPGGGPLHLPVPPAIMAPGGEGHGGGPQRLMATLTVEELADPPALALKRAALAARGWGVELEGLDAALLPLLDAAALPADLLRLHWSEALTAPAAMLALRRIAPARLVLSGVESPAARDWAGMLGITAQEGSLAGGA